MEPRVRDLDRDRDRDLDRLRLPPPPPAKLSIIRLVLDPKSLLLLPDAPDAADDAAALPPPTSLRPPPLRLAWYALRKEASSPPLLALSFMRASQLVSTDALALD